MEKSSRKESFKVIFIISIAILVFLFVIFLIFEINRYLIEKKELQSIGSPQTGIAIMLQKSLNDAAYRYKQENKKAPDKFSDFVILHGSVNKDYTVSLEGIRDDMSQPDSPEDLNTKKMIVDFRDSDLKVTYYLDASKVTASFNEQETNQN